MGSMKLRWISAVSWAFSLLFSMLVFRAFPVFSAIWKDRFILPASRLLHRMTGRFSFPVLEIIVIGALFGLAAGLIRAIGKGLKKCSLLPIASWANAALFFALACIAGYIYLWYPAYWAAYSPDVPIPSSEQLVWLCDGIIDTLNENPLMFSDKASILSEAEKHSRIENARVKAARYPEWMRAIHIAGLYSPWTGEVIVNTEAAPPALPFTAVHELMHLEGIADEGSANIAAWEICREAGGEFEASANLWILKYALALLSDFDPPSVSSRVAKMHPRLYEVFSSMCGPSSAPSVSNTLIAFLGLSETTNSYGNLVGHIIRLHAETPYIPNHAKNPF